MKCHYQHPFSLSTHRVVYFLEDVETEIFHKYTYLVFYKWNAIENLIFLSFGWITFKDDGVGSQWNIFIYSHIQSQGNVRTWKVDTLEAFEINKHLHSVSTLLNEQLDFSSSPILKVPLKLPFECCLWMSYLLNYHIIFIFNVI
jgi:hypothetical protein